MARIHDERPLTDTALPEPTDELSVRWAAGQSEARPAAPAQPHPAAASSSSSTAPTASGDRDPEQEPPSRESSTGPDPDAPGEGIVREEEPAEPNEPG
jgi:hypothetical protein